MFEQILLFLNESLEEFFKETWEESLNYSVEEFFKELVKNPVGGISETSLDDFLEEYIVKYLREFLKEPLRKNADSFSNWSYS